MAMSMVMFVWFSSFFLVALLLAFLVYQLMCLSDLEFDYINTFDTTFRINRFVIPEFALHGVLCLVLLIGGYWFLFLLNVPLMYYHARLYSRKEHLVDVTEVFNHLDYEKNFRLVKLVWYLLLFFVVIYRMLMDLI